MRASTAARGALLALLCWAALPAPARAYEDQVVLGLDIGYARALANDDLPANGLLSGLSVDIGIGDAWAIRCRAAYAFHPGGRPLHLGLAGAEVVYLLDILELVPFFGLGVDGILTQREKALTTQVELQESRIEDFTERLELKRAQLQAQFTAMETALAELQSQQSSLSQLAQLG